MIRLIKATGVATVLLASVLLGASPALAATSPPATNDLLANPTIISPLPFSDSVDTTAATTDANDAQANLQCEAPATNSSVWYDYTPTADQTLVIDASSSTYEVGLIVVTGDPDSFIFQACGPFSVVLPVASGVTYHILAFGDTPGGDGGILNISVDLAPPPPTLAVSLAAPGRVNPKTGVVTLSGTVDCTGGTAATGNISPMATGEGVQLSLDVRQNVGRVSTVHGAVFMSLPCGPATPFTVVVVPDNGLFKPGNVTVTVDAFFCNLSGCAEDLHTVALRIKK